MGHGHHHHGESVSSYFTEQLLTIFVCLLFGFVAIRLYYTGMLEQILAPQFRSWVPAGGAVVLVLVVLRAISVWKEAGELQAQAQANGLTCGLNHTHGPDCDHDPGIGGAHDHDHSHSHDMSWTFARMLILIFPVLLFFLGLPNAGLSQDAQRKMLGNDTALGAEKLKELANDPGTKVIAEESREDGARVRTLQTPTGLKIRQTIPTDGGEAKLEVIAGAGTAMRFNDLNDAAFDEAKRKSLQGETAILEGRFQRLGDKEFTLYRLKMTCCAADTVPLKVRIIAPQSVGTVKDFAWVRVKGQIQFFKVQTGKAGAESYMPVIMVADIADIDANAKPQNEYE